MIVCLFTGLLTPLGDVPYTYLIKTMMGNTTSNINEHLPMTIINHIEILVTVTLIIFLLVCSKAKIKLRDAFMLCGLLFLMLYSRRQESMFVLICGIILNKLLLETLENYREGGINILENILFSKFGVAMISFLIVIFSVYFVVDKKGDTFVNNTTYPTF